MVYLTKLKPLSLAKSVKALAISNRSMTPTKEEIQSWLQQETTKYFFKSLYNQREILKEELTDSKQQEGTDYKRGETAALYRTYNITAEDMIKDYTDTVERHYRKEDDSEEDSEEDNDIIVPF